MSSPLCISIRSQICSILKWSKPSFSVVSYSVTAGINIQLGPPPFLGFKTLFILSDCARCLSTSIILLISFSASVFFNFAAYSARLFKNSCLIFFASLLIASYSFFASLYFAFTSLNFFKLGMIPILYGNFFAFVNCVLQ